MAAARSLFRRSTTAWLVAVGILVLLLGAAWHIAEKAHAAAVKSMVLQGLVGDLAKFHQEHSRLPLNWNEFASWAENAHTARPWTSDELDHRFALRWGAHVSPGGTREDRVFVVLDPAYKDIEEAANEKLHAQCGAPAK